MSAASPFVRLLPLQPSELPAHSLLTSTNSDARPRPDLLLFILALLDQADNALHPFAFSQTFKSHSRKSSPPSNTEVEALSATIPAETISQINWSDPDTTAGAGRNRPRDIPTEHWFARRSYHANTPTKLNPATASWDEFVFGLRDNHSLNEQEFTPTLYDARHILDWNEELNVASEKWRVQAREGTNPGGRPYTNMTLAVYEMCHEIPFPLQPRCFPVLVATASTSANRFIAVTVPMNLSSFDHAFYSNGRNRTEGEDSMRRKQVVLGLYTAIESCELSEHEKSAVGPSGQDKETKITSVGENTGDTRKEQTIEWIMATASDAKGNLPMLVQRNSMPGAIVKDVGYFLNWIHTVDEDVVQGKKAYPYPVPGDRSGSVSSEAGRKRSRGGSTAR